MGGRGGAGGASAENWLKAAENWETWAKWKYRHPSDYVPDSIDKLAADYDKANASYMKRAVQNSSYLSFNKYSNVASYSDPEFSVSVKAPGGGGGGIPHGVVLVDITVPGEKLKRSFFKRISKPWRLQTKKLRAEDRQSAEGDTWVDAAQAVV